MRRATRTLRLPQAQAGVRLTLCLGLIGWATSLSITTSAAAEPKASADSWAEIPFTEPGGDALDTEFEPSRGASPSATRLDPAGGLPPEPPAAGLDARLKWEGNTRSGAAQDPATAGIATLGVKYKLKPDIMLGVLAQFDQAGDTAFAGLRSSPQQSWMAGPAASVRLAPGLVLDARAAWGVGEASAADYGAAGIWTTERRLIDAKLASTQSYGAWRFSPTVTFNYAEDKPDGTTATTLAARSTGAGQVAVTPELAYRIDMPQAMYIEPKAAIGSLWAIEDLSRHGLHDMAHEDLRLKAGAGVTFGSADGTKLEVGAGVEEGAPAAPDVWTGRLQLSVPLK
jgi:hypothetical protein